MRILMVTFLKFFLIWMTLSSNVLQKKIVEMGYTKSQATFRVLIRTLKNHKMNFLMRFPLIVISVKGYPLYNK